MTNKAKGRLIKGSALVLDVGAPLITTITQFPVWIDKGASSTVSGIFLVFALLSIIPFLNQIKALLKSPSVPVLWLVLFVLFSLLRAIIDQMAIICLVGAVGNFIGSILYKTGNVVQNKPD